MTNKREIKPEQKIAQSLVELTEKVEALSSGPLSRHAIVILLASTSGYDRTTIEDVLNAIQALSKNFLNDK